MAGVALSAGLIRVLLGDMMSTRSELASDDYPALPSSGTPRAKLPAAD